MIKCKDCAQINKCSTANDSIISCKGFHPKEVQRNIDNNSNINETTKKVFGNKKENADTIRNMTNKELFSFLNNIQRDKEKFLCVKCGDFTYKKVNLTARKNNQTRTLCVVCENCYDELLNYLGIEDIEWRRK